MKTNILKLFISFVAFLMLSSCVNIAPKTGSYKLGANWVYAATTNHGAAEHYINTSTLGYIGDELVVSTRYIANREINYGGTKSWKGKVLYKFRPKTNEYTLYKMIWQDLAGNVVKTSGPGVVQLYWKIRSGAIEERIFDVAKQHLKK